MIEISKPELIELLRVWINQRPGLEYGNYGERAPYFAEMRSITGQLHDARTLLAHVENSAMTAAELLDGFGAYSGRLQVSPTDKGYRLDYCTGQYWPTEYRAAACAVLAAALWDYHRDDYAASAKGKESAGDAIRRNFKRVFGKRIQSQWFD